jgi:hypothetical protein
MYKSPIEITKCDLTHLVEKAMDELRNEQEISICRVIASHGINVNKDELIKALQYDRDQYNKGYKDGAKELADQLKRALRVFDIELHIIDTILKDMGVNV